MRKRINVQNDVESRRRIAENFPQQNIWKTQGNSEKEVIYAESEEVSEYPVVEATPEPEKKKGRRKATGNA